jgi:hypothetical protein
MPIAGADRRHQQAQGRALRSRLAEVSKLSGMAAAIAAVPPIVRFLMICPTQIAGVAGETTSVLIV